MTRYSQDCHPCGRRGLPGKGTEYIPVGVYAVQRCGAGSKRWSRTRKSRRLISAVVEIMKAEYQPEKIILYGSYAYGKPTEDSDIDLFIIKETDKRRVDRFVEVSRLIYQPGRGIPIEPMVYPPKEVEERLAIGDQFVEEVLSRGEVLYAR